MRPWPEGDLLAQQDEAGQTPLYCAIATKDHKLAKTMCEAHPDIDTVIKIQSKRTNSLHKALEAKLSSNAELITLLIGHSSSDTLRAQNDSGLTPLHLAVDYTRSDDSQLDIVKSIIARCPEAMDTTYVHRERGLLSAYRYHELTYQEALEATARDAKKKSMDKRDGSSPANGQQITRSVKDATQPRPRQQTLLEHGLPLSGSKMSSKSESAPTGKFSTPKTATFDAAPRLHQLSKARTESKLESRNDGKNTSNVSGRVAPPTTAREKNGTTSRKRPKVPKISNIVPTEESAKRTKKYLKLYSLRTKNHDDAVEFLYGVQQGILSPSVSLIFRLYEYL